MRAMSKNYQKHVYPIIELMVDDAAEEASEDGQEITCRKGCSHCCYLLVEVSWEEAETLVDWLEQQDEATRDPILADIRANAATARALFAKRDDTRRFLRPSDDPEAEIPDDACDKYFYELRRPCPFLNLEEGICRAYTARPSSCRLHMVSSDPDYCRPEHHDSDEYEVPESIESLNEEITPLIVAAARRQQWGQLSIILEAVLEERERLASENRPPVRRVPVSNQCATITPLRVPGKKLETL